MERAARTEAAGRDRELPIVGILALQGDFARHATALADAGAHPRLVKIPTDLESVPGLVLPGGESTTLLIHFARGGWDEAIRRFAGRGGALFGTCAGAILLAREALAPVQPTLGVVDITIERNAYGRQRESFETPLEVAGLAGPPLTAVFIRAPRILRVGPGVRVLASYRNDPVLVREGRCLAATFHPELTDDVRIHRMFLDLLAEKSNPATGREPAMTRGSTP